jgi:hypothetical protein
MRGGKGAAPDSMMEGCAFSNGPASRRQGLYSLFADRMERPVGARRSEAKSGESILALGKLLFDILPPIEHTHDFRCVIDDAIEDNMRRGGK